MNMMDTESLIRKKASDLGIPSEDTETFLFFFRTSHPLYDISNSYAEDLLQDSNMMQCHRNILAEGGFEFTPYEFKSFLELVCYMRSLLRGDS